MNHTRWIGLLFTLQLALACACRPAPMPPAQASPQPSASIPTQADTSQGLRITLEGDNRGEYASGQVPAYAKYEVSFQVAGTVARNFSLPYDPAPPPGIDPSLPSYQGISVDALFTPDNWATVYKQPAFYYQDFIQEARSQGEWLYPSGNFSWRARFSPPVPGEWQVKVVAEDASGSTESALLAFTVAPSDNPGFLRLSTADRRYFEYHDGSYFPALGFNLTARQVNPENPRTSSQAYFQKLSENGINFVRLWLSAWGIYGSAWNPWRSIAPMPSQGYLPFTGLALRGADIDTGSETSMIVNARANPCMFIGWEAPPPAVKRDTAYRIRVRYKTELIQGPRQADQPYGLVAKLGDPARDSWLWGERGNCNDSGSGITITQHESQNTIDQPDPWRELQGTWVSGEADFLPYFYIVMENAEQGRAHIDRVWIEEDLGDGSYGPNILPRPWMSHHLYFEQRNSFAFDQVIHAAQQYGIAFKLVVMEKDEWTLNRILPDGSADEDSPSNDNFYGADREVTKVRWLQQAYWRYLQARWGYSTAIHSWELLNEGNPANLFHYILADEFGKFMECRVFGIAVEAKDGETCLYQHPNAHLVTTSFWHSYPLKPFWTNPQFPNLDYADLHAYISTGWIENPALAFDAAAYHIEYSRAARRGMLNNAGVAGVLPIVRGEAGLDSPGQQVEQPDLVNDTYGVWLHNFVWAALEAGSLVDLYWWNDNIERQPGPDGEPGLHEIYAPFAEFIGDIPLNNGLYQEAVAQASNPQLRVVGQKDTQNNRAHLWVQNTAHTWRNVLNNPDAAWGLGGVLRLDGFAPGATLPVTWYLFNSHGELAVSRSTVMVNGEGGLSLSLPDDPAVTDAGVKIGEYERSEE